MMRNSPLLTLVLAIAFASPEVHAQRSQKKDADFVRSRPAVGDVLPNVSVYTPDGQAFQTGGLRGQYTVLVFGCLT